MHSRRRLRTTLRDFAAHDVLQFARVHQTLKTTPAVAAGVTDHVWSVEEIVALLDSK